ncbi:MAG: DUF5606 domain-containing protein [Bacteroidales bacterium]
MLKQILSISGKPGLYKLISYSKNIVIVENLITNKRTPAYSHDKIISLGDISIYTDSGEVPLNEVFKTIGSKFETKVIDAKSYQKPAELEGFFAEILPDFDRERVYNNDIKKIITWYNILVESGNTDFEIEAPDEPEAETAAE